MILARKAVLLTAIVSLLAGSLNAQDKDGPPAPKSFSLDTEDHVVLHCTYFPGTRKKKTVPIILIHSWDASRAEMAPMAQYLQRLGHAVLLPDLRGHGRSTTVSVNGAEDQIDRSMMRRSHIEAVTLDLQACKKFLIEEHNKGELNIELLCLVGADEGAVFAMNFAAFDWSKQQLPAYKLGRDVAALVLLSPPNSFKGITTAKAAKHPVILHKMSILIAVGSGDRKSYSAAKRLHNGLERPREKPEDIRDQTLFLLEPDTSLTGAALLSGRGLRVAQDVANFINLRLVVNSNAPEWKARRKPGSDE